MSISIMVYEIADSYIMHADTYLAGLDVANYKYTSTQAGRAFVKGLLEPFRMMTSLLLLYGHSSH